jgi:hypothetical protein
MLPKNADAVLDVFDRNRSILPFLANDGRMHLTDGRLSVFRSDADWVVFLEFIQYWEGTADFCNVLSTVGSIVEGGGQQYFLEGLIQQVPDRPLWREGVEDHDPWMTWLGDRSGFSALVRGVRHDIQPSTAEYYAAGIVFADGETGPGSIEPGFLLRFLCHRLGHPFFLTDDELLGIAAHPGEWLEDGEWAGGSAVVAQGATPGPRLPLLLRTPDWHNPANIDDLTDLFPASTSTDRIVEIPCFQILASAIVSGDLSEWNAQDPATFNTNWESLEQIRNS